MKSSNATLFVALAVAVLTPTAPWAGEVAEIEIVAPADQRFARADATESPDFQKHVVPLLGRLGCNGRSCHGSFQGRGGFRLSLFGYDFDMDHRSLVAESSSGALRRTNPGSPPDSLVITKPTLQADHEGGKRFELDSWQHHLLLRWIQAGARGAQSPRELQRLEIQPSEVVFDHRDQTAELRVIAVWEDGTREDVTPLCRFRTNDDTVATVDQAGRVVSAGPGDTHVIAFYDNGVAAAGVIRPQSGRPVADFPPAKSTIDQLVQAKLKKLGVLPSPVCSDAQFLRRISIDLTGSLPTPGEVEAFLADDRPDKRLRKIDQLLEQPAYAAWWTNKLCDFTGCNPTQQAELGQQSAVQWYMWIYQRVADNIPYDQLVSGIVMAMGRDPGQSEDDYYDQVSMAYRDPSGQRFAQRQSMPHYWTRRSMEKPEDKAMAVAHSFLGLRLQCAQCHKHPFAPWTQQDFQQFTSFFDNVRFGVPPDSQTRYRELAKQVGLNVRGDNGAAVRRDVLNRAGNKTVPWREVYIATRPSSAELRLLRSGSVTLQTDQDPREPIMRWMMEEDNPWFARALVSRVWASYFHVGLVDPPDDLNPANPPSNPALLEWLTRRFVQQGFDMKWLHRTIVSSDTYQRSWRPNETNRGDRRNFSRAIPRRIPAEVVYDAVKQAVAPSDQLEQVRSNLARRASGHLSMRLAGTYAMRVFGKPDRSLNCDCQRVNRPTLLQSVFLQNDPLMDQRLSDGGWLEEIASREDAGEPIDAEQLIRQAWLRTLSRPPSPREIGRASDHLAAAATLADGMRDLLWALLNTKEFILNH